MCPEDPEEGHTHARTHAHAHARAHTQVRELVSGEIVGSSRARESYLPLYSGEIGHKVKL
jgi:hypothetical protein